MQAAMPALAIHILDLVAEHGAVSTSQIMRATKRPRSTIKKRLAELVDAGHLTLVGEGRAARYVQA